MESEREGSRSRRSNGGYGGDSQKLPPADGLIEREEMGFAFGLSITPNWATNPHLPRLARHAPNT